MLSLSWSRSPVRQYPQNLKTLILSEHDGISKEFLVVIPTYNNASTLKGVVEGVLEHCGNVLVVNDGCTDGTTGILRGLSGRINVLTHPFNYGKGQALMNGLQWAKQEGFRYVITIDSDGQHSPGDIEVFKKRIAEVPDSLLVGARNLNADGMPGKNTFANKFSNFWYKLETGIPLTDTQSGFRLYPVQKMNLDNKHYTRGYEFELQAIVFSAWDGINVENVPVNVYYPEDGVSHFKPGRDFLRITVFNTMAVLWLFFWRWPVNFFKKLSWKNVKSFIDKQIIHSDESNLTVAGSIGIGVFMGIVPLWGYQMLIAIALAHVLRLNKIIAVAASNISIPPMIPFILFGSYWTGCAVTGVPLNYSFSDFDMAKAGLVLWQYVIGAVVLASVAGLASTLLSWTLMVVCKRKRRSER